MKILWGVESPQAATTRYRVIVPSRPLLKLDWQIDVAERVYQDAIKNYDIVCLQRSSTRDALTLIEEAHELGISVVYDIDDDIFSIGTDSPVFRIYLDNPAVPWNQIMGIRFASCVSVSTPRLRHVYSPINPNCSVLPNFVDLKDWEHLGPRFKWDSEIVMVWAGSNTHAESLSLLDKPLEAIASRYKNFSLVLMGLDASPFKAVRDRTALFGWSSYKSYQRVLASADIGLAPLAPTLFNLGKSAIRIQEYASAGLAIVGSDTGEYTRAIREAGGVLCSTDEDWINALSTLIEDRQELKRRKEFARAWATTQDIWREGNWSMWHKFFIEVHDSARR